MPGINYIINSTKPFPAWIKEHRVFKNLSRIDKVFPHIGLPNFTEDITVYSAESAKSIARQLVYLMLSILNEMVFSLKTLLAKEMLDSGKERNEKCNAIQSAINIISMLTYSLSGKELCSVVENKVVMSIPTDIFSGASSSPVFKKGEAFLKVLNKINLVLAEIKPDNSLKVNYENDYYYKEFSKLNIPNKAYKLTFSSSGEEGAWDIATASMRGIISCQAWTAAQSRGLIGSISSKYVGVVFVSGTQDFHPYGKQMIFRSMVRLVVNRATGTPALYMDTMYPAYNADIMSAIRKTLNDRSGLVVYSASFAEEKNMVTRDYYLLDEVSRSFLREGEFSYMDSPLHIEKRRNPILFSKENKKLLERRGFFLSKLEKVISDKRAAYTKNLKELSEGKKPEIAPAFNDLKKGQYAFQNTLNFFAHCDRPHSTTNKPTSFFLLEIFKAIGNTDQPFETNKDCDIWILKNLVNNLEEIKEKSWKNLQSGSWMKAFPAASKRFHETLITDLKKELLIACKGA
jgi:hypothetical protein